MSPILSTAPTAPSLNPPPRKLVDVSVQMFGAYVAERPVVPAPLPGPEQFCPADADLALDVLFAAVVDRPVVVQAIVGPFSSLNTRASFVTFNSINSAKWTVMVFGEGIALTVPVSLSPMLTTTIFFLCSCQHAALLAPSQVCLVGLNGAGHQLLSRYGAPHLPEPVQQEPRRALAYSQNPCPSVRWIRPWDAWRADRRPQPTFGS